MLDNLFIEKTKYTPRVVSDTERHILEIRGESYPEDTSEFYGPLLAWLERCLRELPDDRTLTLEIEMIYYNSNSSMNLMNMFRMLRNAVAEGKHIVVNWYYDRENDMAQENGEEFKEDLETLPFNLIPVGDEG